MTLAPEHHLSTFHEWGGGQQRPSPALPHLAILTFISSDPEFVCVVQNTVGNKRLLDIRMELYREQLICTVVRTATVYTPHPGTSPQTQGTMPAT